MSKHFKSCDEIKTSFIEGKNFFDFEINSDLFLIDDVKIEFYNKSGLANKKMFHFWFHTSFIDKTGVLVLPKAEIDKAKKDKKWRVFDKSFTTMLSRSSSFLRWTSPKRSTPTKKHSSLRNSRRCRSCTSSSRFSDFMQLSQAFMCLNIWFQYLF